MWHYYPRDSFAITFPKRCGIGESIWTTTCPKTVFGVSKGKLPVKCFCLQSLFFVSDEINGDHKTA